MTVQYSIADARRNLVALVHKLEKQSTIEITRRGKPVAVLMSLQEYQRLSAERLGFWATYSDFREEVDMADLNIKPEMFAGIRSQEPGREVDL